MPQLRLTVQSVTPLLMYGAHNKDDRQNPSLEARPELRAPSIRGMLRYWLRAVLGSQLVSPDDVFEQESAILGSTQQGSKIQLRVYRGSTIPSQGKLMVLPGQTRGFSLSHTGFPPNSEFRITLSAHPLYRGKALDYDGPLLKAVFLMVHMGGLGRRSRRGSGNLRVLNADLDERRQESDLRLAKVPGDRYELANYLTDVCEFVSPRTQTLGRRPSFPVFAFDTAVVLLGRHQPHASYEKAFDELWRVSGPYHKEGGIFGDVRPRRSSAIHMRVAETESGYVAQQTILYSGNGQWNVMQDYINHCCTAGFDDIYGTWGHWK